MGGDAEEEAERRPRKALLFFVSPSENERVFGAPLCARGAFFDVWDKRRRSALQRENGV
jgi:hypothetical protein